MPRPTLPWPRLFAEFLVIVVGVLVALGVDSWVQYREDRTRERAYGLELLADVVETQQAIEILIEGHTEQRRLLQKLDDGFSSSITPPADSMGHWFEHSLRGAAFRPSAATADALIESGDLSLIQDDDLRRGIIRYRNTIQNVRQVMDGYSQMSMDALASINRRVDRERAARGDVDWQTMAGDTPVRGDLRTFAIAVTAQLSFFGTLLDVADELEVLLVSQETED